MRGVDIPRHLRYILTIPIALGGTSAMAETRKLRSPVTGTFIEAPIVPIRSIKNEPIIIELEDGSLLRFKVDIVEILRIPTLRDQEGHPVYNVRNVNSMSVLDSPLELRS